MNNKPMNTGQVNHRTITAEFAQSSVSNNLRIRNKPTVVEKPTATAVLGYSARVLSIKMQPDKTIEYQLDMQGVDKMAVAAEGLLVCPEVGDLVLCMQCENGFFVSQVIKRQQSSASLIVSSSRPVEWVAPVLRFKALQEMEFLSAHKLTLSACDVIVGAGRTLVQQARNLMQQASTYSLTTKGLMKMSGRQQLIVAEEDLRMDAKRINMG